MIVEDEWLIAVDLQDALEAAGFAIVGPASTVAQALDIVEREAIDAGLLDLHVGSEPAYPVADALRQRGIPFAFLTGHSRADLRPEYRDEILLAKPVAIGVLRIRLDAMLRGGNS